jgi:flagellar biosynthesis protein FlhF
MKYITIVDKDFESAVKKARDTYGHAVRIHSRRDVNHRGGFLWLKQKPQVELTCYLADVISDHSPSIIEKIEKENLVEEPKEAKAEIEEPKEEKSEIEEPLKEEKEIEVPLNSIKDTLLEHAKNILDENQFSSIVRETILTLLAEELKGITSYPSSEEFELMIVDKIVSLIAIDHETQLHPPHFFILMGPTGTGKTTTIAKIGALWSLQQDEDFYHSVKFVTLDTFRVGAYEQLAAFGSSLHIDIDLVKSEEDVYRVIEQTKDIDVVLVDTIGKSPKDKELTIKMQTLLSVIPNDQKKIYIALSSSMKQEDIMKSIEMYASFGITSIVITKVDETQSIGNILSVAYEKNLPLLFITDGQRVPSDIHKASAATMLSLLHGLSLDFESLWSNQSNLLFTEH